MKNHDFNNPRIRAGFTLTELLVVITIIVVLAAHSILGVKRIRDTAHKANSIRNLSQLQIANITYASDHNKWNFDNPNDSKTGAGDIAYRHGNKVLVVYFDGHVGEMSKADLQEIDKSRGGKSNAFWRPKP